MNSQFEEDYRNGKAIIDKYLPPEVIARLLGNPKKALKIEYNRLVKQEIKLTEDLNSRGFIPDEEEKIKQYKQITNRMDGILSELQRMGESVSDNQVENGF